MIPWKSSNYNINASFFSPSLEFGIVYSIKLAGLRTSIFFLFSAKFLPEVKFSSVLLFQGTTALKYYILVPSNERYRCVKHFYWAEGRSFNSLSHSSVKWGKKVLWCHFVDSTFVYFHLFLYLELNCAFICPDKEEDKSAQDANMEVAQVRSIVSAVPLTIYIYFMLKSFVVCCQLPIRILTKYTSLTWKKKYLIDQAAGRLQAWVSIMPSTQKQF